MSIIRPPRRNPFVGPRPVEAGETLFGREREARELQALLVAERIVLLYSPSGAGKTSLVQAALIPGLTERDFFVRPIVRVNLAPPGEGNRYLLGTMVALEEAQPEAEQLPVDALAGLTLAEYLGRRPPPAEADGEVLIFDQFEEILTTDPLDEAGRLAFFAQLGEALRERTRWALFMMREDYIAGLDPYLLPIPTRLNNTYRLDLLGLGAAQEVMRGLAGAAGVVFEPMAAERLASDLSRTLTQAPDGRLVTRPGLSVEPVQLQVVCRRLWEGLPPGADQIAMAEVATLGDVDESLGDYYALQVARAAATSSIGEREVRVWFDRRLITPQGIRSAVLQEAEAAEGLPVAAAALLRDAYLVRSERRRGATWLELAHDRLVEPVRRSNAAWFSANLSTLQRQAELWDEQRQPAGLLLREEALAEAEAWAAANPSALNMTEARFLERCREAREALDRERRQARRIRQLAIGASLLSILALAALAVALVFFTRSEQQRRAANVRAGAASALSTLNTDPALSVILAGQAVRANLAAGDPLADEAREALQQAIMTSRIRRIITAYPSEAEVRGLQSLAFSPDGALLAATSNTGALLLYDVAAGAELARLPGDQLGLNGVAFSPDGEHVAAAGEGGDVLIWDTATGERSLNLDADLDRALDVAYSPDGAQIVAAATDGTARIWDAASGEQLVTLEGHEGEVNSASYSRDGAWLVTASDDGTARIWDVFSGEELLRLEDPESAPMLLDAAFSPDGALVATVSDDQVARLWDVDSGQLLNTLRGHGSTIDSVSFSPDGSRIATGSADTTARIWDLSNSQQLLTLAGHFDSVSGVAFSPDGHTVVTSSLDGTLRWWNPGLAPAGGASYIAFSPGGDQLATAGDAGAYVWNPATGEEVFAIGTEEPASAVAYDSDGARLAVGTIGIQLLIVDGASGVALAQLAENPYGVNKLAFSPDGSLLATAGHDGLVRLWEPESNTIARELVLRQEDAEPVFSLAFSPDGSLLAAGDEFGAIAVWSVEDGEQRLSLAITSQQPVNGLAFTPDGRLLAAADAEGLVWIWDAANGAEVRRILAPDQVLDLAFSPDGALLATGGTDRAVTLWDTTAWEQRGRLPYPSSINSLGFSPDGAWLATASDDGIARMLPLALDELLRMAEARTVRTPTAAECQQYGLEGCDPAGAEHGEAR